MLVSHNKGLFLFQFSLSGEARRCSPHIQELRLLPSPDVTHHPQHVASTLPLNRKREQRIKYGVMSPVRWRSQKSVVLEKQKEGSNQIGGSEKSCQIRKGENWLLGLATWMPFVTMLRLWGGILDWSEP